MTTPELERILSALSQSVIDVFAMMCSVTVKQEKRSMKTRSSAAYDCSAVMSLTGRVSGSLVISFPHETVVAFTTRFLGEEVNGHTEYLTDATGEFINVIVGDFLERLPEGQEVKWTIPTMITGDGHEIWHRRDLPCTVLEFSSDCGPLSVEISLKAPTLAKHGSRILLADGDPETRRLLGKALMDRGHSVSFAAEGYEAAVALRDRNIDLVVTDLQIPDVEGVEIIKIYRALDSWVPIVVVTTAVDEWQERAMAAGATMVLSKTMNVNDLSERLREILETRKLL